MDLLALGDDPQRLYVIQTALNNAALSEARLWSHNWYGEAIGLSGRALETHREQCRDCLRIAELGGAALSDDGAPGQHDRCSNCGFHVIGAALGPTGAKIEAAGYCSNCLMALDGSGKKLTREQVWEMKVGPDER